MKPKSHGRPAAEMLRSLSKEEIDHRMQQVIDEIAASGAPVGEPGPGAQPRWISSAELVRRMRPFLVYN